MKLLVINLILINSLTCASEKGRYQGVFQLESGGNDETSYGFGTGVFEDLILLVALYQSLTIRNGNGRRFSLQDVMVKTAEMLHPLLEPVLKDTFGVILYQEQVMQITSVLAGFSLGQADILRRAMGKKKAKELDSMREALLMEPQQKHGISPQLSSEICSPTAFAGWRVQ